MPSILIWAFHFLSSCSSSLTNLGAYSRLAPWTPILPLLRRLLLPLVLRKVHGLVEEGSLLVYLPASFSSGVAQVLALAIDHDLGLPLLLLLFTATPTNLEQIDGGDDDDDDDA